MATMTPLRLTQQRQAVARRLGRLTRLGETGTLAPPAPRRGKRGDGTRLFPTVGIPVPVAKQPAGAPPIDRLPRCPRPACGGVLMAFGDDPPTCLLCGRPASARAGAPDGSPLLTGLQTNPL